MAWQELNVKLANVQFVKEMLQVLTDMMLLLGVEVVPALMVTLVRVDVALSDRERSDPPLDEKVSVVNVTFALDVDATKSWLVAERESLHAVMVTIVSDMDVPMSVRVEVTE